MVGPMAAPPGQGDYDYDANNDCTIFVPTAQGTVPIYVTDGHICSEYEARGHDFCALDPSFRDTWENQCIAPAPADAVLGPDPGVVVDGPASDVQQPAAQDLTMYYSVVGGVFGLGMLAMGVIGVVICLDGWRRRARARARGADSNSW
ncbi:hypothetical protein F4677DRAFT_441622 [Hypoxylon crocopeplum]|nr:hypothetical protein F4677DRAFT_441622 [Hypoxylon crocopeplum]